VEGTFAVTEIAPSLDEFDAALSRQRLATASGSEPVAV
jgi:hypothetical protein